VHQSAEVIAVEDAITAELLAVFSSSQRRFPSGYRT
ncbi:uncharacterized protein METZ01_LOCUS307609, partial [marine metagenome]